MLVYCNACIIFYFCSILINFLFNKLLRWCGIICFNKNEKKMCGFFFGEGEGGREFKQILPLAVKTVFFCDELEDEVERGVSGDTREVVSAPWEMGDMEIWRPWDGDKLEKDPGILRTGGKFPSPISVCRGTLMVVRLVLESRSPEDPE